MFYSPSLEYLFYLNELLYFGLILRVVYNFCKAAEVLTKHYGVNFRLDFQIPIGKPPKDHKFDLVSEDEEIIGECKNYSWTETGNIPSAKMEFTNEAASRNNR